MSKTTSSNFVRSSERQRPLMMHLTLAAGAFAQQGDFQDEPFQGDEFWQQGRGRQVISSMEKVVEGLKQYQLHPYARAPQSRSIVWSDGEMRIVWYAGGRKKIKGSVVIIPSMINGAEILDILPQERSLVHWLTRQGFDVFVIEWGNLRNDAELATLDLALGTKLVRGLEWLKKETEGAPLTGMGYCMGGLFLAAGAVLRPDIFDKLVFIAAPWDFASGAEGNLPQAVRGWARDGLSRVAHLDYMPMEWMQMIFAGVDPTLVARKFAAFADMDMGSAQARLFVAVEDWVNGGIDLPAGIVRQCVGDWYVDNKPVSGTWTIAGEVIDAAKIAAPSLVIVPQRDRIVPPESAEPLSTLVQDGYVLEVDCGHISMMVGSDAPSHVWEPMRDWMLE